MDTDAKTISPLTVACATLAAAVLWMALVINIRYEGEWTALFYVGEKFPQPPGSTRGVYVFKNSSGYDGQMYRTIARDPFLRRGYEKYADAPEVRWRRILVPLLAWMAALGQDDWVDVTYFAIILACVFWGAFWAARLASKLGYPPWFGAGFLLLPATLVALDRMTVDVALAALLFALLATWEDGPAWRVWLFAAGAGLCRETGLLLVGALVATWTYRRKFAMAAIMATAALPAVAWIMFVHLHTPRSGLEFAGWIPLEGLLRRFAHPIQYPAAVPFKPFLVALDYMALLGVVLAVMLVLRYRPSLGTVLGAATWLLLIPVLFTKFPDIWSEPFAYGRTMTPFWASIALQGALRRDWMGLVPVILIDLPIGVQFAAYLTGFVRSL